MYTEKLGRIKVDEILISHTSKSIYVQTIGMKNILLSKNLIQLYDWINIKDSYSVPFTDATGSIKGCELIL